MASGCVVIGRRYVLECQPTKLVYTPLEGRRPWKEVYIIIVHRTDNSDKILNNMVQSVNLVRPGAAGGG